MSLYKANGCWIDVGKALGHGDDLCLTADTGGREADLVRAVVVDRTGEKCGIDRVFVLDRFFKSLQDDHGCATAADCSICFRSEGTAMAIGRCDAPLSKEVTSFLWGCN